MSTTLALNSDRTVWVTTYAGQTGRCYDFSIEADEETQVTRTFTEAELYALLHNGGVIRGLAKPEFDNDGRALTPREEAEPVFRLW